MIAFTKTVYAESIFHLPFANATPLGSPEYNHTISRIKIRQFNYIHLLDVVAIETNKSIDEATFISPDLTTNTSNGPEVSPTYRVTTRRENITSTNLKAMKT